MKLLSTYLVAWLTFCTAGSACTNVLPPVLSVAKIAMLKSFPANLQYPALAYK